MNIPGLTIKREVFQLAEVFAISRGARTEAQVIKVELSVDGVTGCGECVPYARYDETLDSVEDQIQSVAAALANGLDRDALQTLLPAGAARNAVDCALWDLESKLSHQPVWQLAGLPEPAELTTAYTLSLAEPETMLEKARQNAFRPLLKIKLGGQGDIERLQAVRAGAPDTNIIVDANEGWTADSYQSLLPVLQELGVSMVEQPFPATADDFLLDRAQVLEGSTLSICADESCHDVASLPALKGKYDMVNIKLDKTGGLTEAIRLREAAIAADFKVMVGCMVGTSLAMAPAMLVAAGAEVVDLDGPLLLAEDRTPALQYRESQLMPAPAELWG